MRRFPVICGPTASGKSSLAVEIATRLRQRHAIEAEVLAADAFQVYRGMDIGTAKPALAERRGVPHRLIDLVEPVGRFTVDQWLERAEATVGELRGRQPPACPIVVGGTHLYVKAFMEGLFDGPGADAALRDELAAMDPAARRAELERVDPAAAARIHPADLRRTIRALEVFRLTGRPISEHQRQWDAAGPRQDALLVALHLPVEALNRRINARVRDMMNAGLLEEVQALHAGGRFGPQAREALGYKQLIEHLEGRLPLEDAVERIKIETRRFAKNQRTWLRRLSILPGAMSVNVEESSPQTTAELIVARLLDAARPAPGGDAGDCA
ncbi:MAG: tRNA (adenosine(37)-N6)-dimethylallyltransferase MiaA [Phycisphaerales bacterium]